MKATFSGHASKNVREKCKRGEDAINKTFKTAPQHTTGLMADLPAPITHHKASDHARHGYASLDAPGGFSQVLSELREQMIRSSALIEPELDFSQEEVEFADRTQFYSLLRYALTVSRRLMDSFNMATSFAMVCVWPSSAGPMRARARC